MCVDIALLWAYFIVLFLFVIHYYRDYYFVFTLFCVTNFFWEIWWRVTVCLLLLLSNLIVWYLPPFLLCAYMCALHIFREWINTIPKSSDDLYISVLNKMIFMRRFFPEKHTHTLFSAVLSPFSKCLFYFYFQTPNMAEMHIITQRKNIIWKWNIHASGSNNKKRTHDDDVEQK